ncbi:MAG TPA: hypothetical protein VGK19_25240 [Capsulimonadaceae bacterium]|jgi:hypothetical protein
MDPGFGGLDAHAGSLVSPFGFGGAVGYYDDDALLVYVRDRYYAPTLGRWSTSATATTRRRWAAGSAATGWGLGAGTGTCTGTWGTGR